MKKLLGLILISIASVAIAPQAKASDVNMSLLTTSPTQCSSPGSTFLNTTWYLLLYPGSYWYMKDVLTLLPVQGSNGTNYWHCTGNYTAAIFWKDMSLGICSGTAQANLTATAICNSNGYCTPADPGPPYDYTIHWNNPACS
jgi:hypothetical protein